MSLAEHPVIYYEDFGLRTSPFRYKNLLVHVILSVALIGRSQCCFLSASERYGFLGRSRQLT